MVAHAHRAFATRPHTEQPMKTHGPTPFDVAAVAPPAGSYSHAVSAAGDLEWLHLSGQIGRSADGSIPATIDAQARQLWTNVLAILSSRGMTPRHIVKITNYLVSRADFPPYRSAREAALSGHRPASTLLYVAGLVSQDVLVEVDVVAAAPRAGASGDAR